MQGGNDAADWKPICLDPKAGEPYGTHRGHMKALNVRGLRPGYHVAYAHRGAQYAGFTQSMLLQGYRPVTAESGTKCGAQLPDGFGAPQDSSVGFGNLMLMEIPLERYAELKQEQARQRAAASDTPTRAFLDRASEFQAAYGPGSSRLNPVFALPQHGRNGYETKEMP